MSRRRKPTPNESRPLAIRIGNLRPELDARSDGSESGYRTVIMDALNTYFDLMRENTPLCGMQAARDLFMRDANIPKSLNALEQAALNDAMHRALTLYTHAGLTVDEALVAAGLVKGEE